LTCKLVKALPPIGVLVGLVGVLLILAPRVVVGSPVVTSLASVGAGVGISVVGVAVSAAEVLCHLFFVAAVIEEADVIGDAEEEEDDEADGVLCAGA
jgi:hypothetical protein